MLGEMRVLKGLLLLALLLPGIVVAGADPTDPLEGYNRAMFSFNDKADRWVLKPVAKGYRAVTPDPVERGVSRMFSNLGEVLNIVNDLLQGKVGQAGNDGGRLLINSTIGLAGFFDVARHAGLLKSDGEDFGQTFGVWGLGEGAYVVLPFLGPSTLRDAPGLLLDGVFQPIGEIDHVPTRNQIYGVQVVSGRADLLEAEKLIKGDRYTFIRDVYLQRRQFLVNDGEVEDDFGDDDYN
ncbi:MAG: VacJ family lipoprotein [Gammaproteobacteria bacterium]|nr:VacJ family lipoprotein [Gammaproteobacteria bacterium]MBQ0840190.1 VacJ family lipoprotein [Gammaproteobacteria bacterium]